MRFLPLVTLTLSIAFVAHAQTDPSNGDAVKLRVEKKKLTQEYQKQIDQSSKGMKLKPYLGVKIKSNFDEFKECAKRSVAKEKLDSKAIDIEKNCQCYYVQIDGLDMSPEHLDEAIKRSSFARSRCLIEAKR